MKIITQKTKRKETTFNNIFCNDIRYKNIIFEMGKTMKEQLFYFLEGFPHDYAKLTVQQGVGGRQKRKEVIVTVRLEHSKGLPCHR